MSVLLRNVFFPSPGEQILDSIYFFKMKIIYVLLKFHKRNFLQGLNTPSSLTIDVKVPFATTTTSSLNGFIKF